MFPEIGVELLLRGFRDKERFHGYDSGKCTRVLLGEVMLEFLSRVVAAADHAHYFLDLEQLSRWISDFRRSGHCVAPDLR